MSGIILVAVKNKKLVLFSDSSVLSSGENNCSCVYLYPGAVLTRWTFCSYIVDHVHCHIACSEIVLPCISLNVDRRHNVWSNIYLLYYTIPSTQHKIKSYRYMFRLKKSSSGVSKNHKINYNMPVHIWDPRWFTMCLCFDDWIMHNKVFLLPQCHHMFLWTSAVSLLVVAIV